MATPTTTTTTSTTTSKSPITTDSGASKKAVAFGTTLQSTAPNKTKQTSRFGDQYLTKAEWTDVIRRNELYLMVLLFVYLVLALLIGLLCIFGHTEGAWDWTELNTQYYGGIWRFCEKRYDGSTHCEAVTKSVIYDNDRYLYEDNYSDYVATRAFLILAELYNFPLIVIPIIILGMKLYNPILFCGMTLTGVSMWLWLVVAASLATKIFHNNCPQRNTCSCWSVQVLWVNMVLSILMVALPICMYYMTKRIEELKVEAERQRFYEPITHEQFEITVSNHS